MKAMIASIVLAMFFGLPALAQPTESTGTPVKMTTYTYATNDGQALELDIYVDETVPVTGKRPVMIFSYGGAWENGRKEDGTAFSEAFAREGFVAVSINYRLGIRKLREQGTQVGQNNFASAYSNAIRMGVEDLFDATRFVLDRADELNIDPAKVLICGSSAGAINSMTAEYFICTDHPIATSRLPQGFNYAGVISCAGGVWVAETTELDWKKTPCPVLAFHGTKDQLVPFGKSVMGGGDLGAFGPDYFIPQLQALQVPCIKHVFNEADHIIAMIYNNVPARHEMFGFIDRIFAGDKISVVSTETYYDKAPTLQDLYRAAAQQQRQ